MSTEGQMNETEVTEDMGLVDEAGYAEDMADADASAFATK